LTHNQSINQPFIQSFIHSFIHSRKQDEPTYRRRDGDGKKQRSGKRPFDRRRITLVTSVPSVVLDRRCHLFLELTQRLVHARRQPRSVDGGQDDAGVARLVLSDAAVPRMLWGAAAQLVVDQRNDAVDDIVGPLLPVFGHILHDFGLVRCLERLEKETAEDGIGYDHGSEADLGKQEGEQPPTAVAHSAISRVPVVRRVIGDGGRGGGASCRRRLRLAAAAARGHHIVSMRPRSPAF
jgi:hypothetical protein